MKSIAALLIGIFAFSASINIAILVSCLVLKRRGSMLFLFGGVMGSARFLLTPALRPWAWLPPLLDPATLFFSVGLPRLLFELWRTSSFNLVSSYGASLGHREVRLRLYRKQVFTLQQSFTRPPGELGVIELSRIGSWRWEEGRLVLQFGDEAAIFELVTSVEGQSIRQCVGLPSFEADPELSLVGVELVGEVMVGS